MRSDRSVGAETLAVHGDGNVEETADIAPPIHMTSTFAASSAAEFAEMATVPRHPRYYTRDGNPSHRRVEAVIAALEGGEGATVTASGMGAISTTMLSLVKAGDSVVAQRSHYMGSAKLLGELLPRFGVDVTLVDQTDVAAFEAAATDRTTVVVVETPSNPTGQLTDLAAVAALARVRGITTICDNTFASPVNQRPLDLGIDIVVHSGTKYLGGHHDLLAGAIVTTNERLDRIWHTSQVLGAVLGPFDAWLLLRGIRTLPIRVRQHNESGCAVAAWLEGRPEVAAVHYPGLPSHPQHDLARRQMTGFGGTFSFQVDGGYAETQRFMAGLKLTKQAVSLGGFETLAVHAAAMWNGFLSDEQVREAGVEPNMVRISLGLEAAEDIVADLEGALRAV